MAPAGRVKLCCYKLILSFEYRHGLCQVMLSSGEHCWPCKRLILLMFVCQTMLLGANDLPRNGLRLSEGAP